MITRSQVSFVLCLVGIAGCANGSASSVDASAKKFNGGNAAANANGASGTSNTSSASTQIATRASVARPAIATATKPLPPPAFVGGTVQALALDETKAYVGGSFTGVGLHAGGLALLDPGTGASTAYPIELASKTGAPSVTKIAADANGGAYLFGAFDHADGMAVNGLVHVNADGSLDAAFAPDTIEGQIVDIAYGPSGLYVVGTITKIAGATRTGCAALDPETGAVLPWAPACTGANAVAVAGNKVYVATNAAMNTGTIVEVDHVTGAVLATHTLTANSAGSAQVRALAPVDDTMYIGGDFVAIDDAPHAHLAALDVQTDALKSFDAQIGDGASPATVHAIAGFGSRVFFTGTFASVGGYTRMGFAEVDSASGAVSDFAPELGGMQSASFALIGTTLAVGGSFTSVNGSDNVGLASIDLTTNTLIDLGGPIARASAQSNSVGAVANVNGSLMAGGAFSATHAVPRAAIAALDLETHALSDWAGGVVSTGAAASVAAITVGNGMVYVGGRFDHAQQIQTSSLAGANGVVAFSADTGELLPWTPPTLPPGAKINALAVTKDTLYLAGDFHAIGSLARNNVAALDAQTGDLLPWNANVVAKTLPNDASSVFAIATQGPDVYLGGIFDYAGRAACENLAAVDGVTGTATSFLPPSRPVSNIFAFASYVVAQEASSAGPGFVTYDASSATTHWRDATFAASATDGTTVYAAIRSGETYSFKAMSLDTGKRADWAPPAVTSTSPIFMAANARAVVVSTSNGVVLAAPAARVSY